MVAPRHFSEISFSDRPGVLNSPRRSSKETSLTAKNSPARRPCVESRGEGPEADWVSLATNNSLPATSASSPATRNSLPATPATRRRKGFSSAPMSQTPYKSDFFSERQNFFETPSTRTRTSSFEGGVEGRASRVERRVCLGRHKSGRESRGTRVEWRGRWMKKAKSRGLGILGAGRWSLDARHHLA